MTSQAGRDSPRIAVLGAGFAGLTFCQSFPPELAQVTLVDRQNHHLFQPLLYQMATAGLAAPDIAQPIRSILSGRANTTILMDRVAGIDLPARTVRLETARLPYDYLVLALGGTTSYFGHPEWEKFASGLKTLDDALRIRREVLLAFERAETEPDPARRAELMTLVVVGGGPTGVELAGAFAELARRVLARDFHRIDPRQARVVLIEGSPRVLGHLPPDLSASAAAQLRQLGVEIRTGAMVKAVRQNEIELPGETLRASTIIWAAGVAATPLTRQLGVEVDRAGRIKVAPDLSVPGHPEVFAVGDMVALVDARGVVVPGVSPAAIQMGRHAAKLIADELRARRPAAPGRAAFVYWDKGTMATIGRSRAVAMIGKLKLHGFPAWLAWLLVHLVFLIGFRNKISVLMNWTYNYLAYKRGTRIIFGGDSGSG
jgi:NADH dehydrogenase